MCLLNVKHPYQPRLANSPSNGNLVPVLTAAVHDATQRRPIRLRIPVDSSASLLSLVSLKQSSRISAALSSAASFTLNFSASVRPKQPDHRSSFESFKPFKPLGSSLARPSSSHCFCYKSSRFIFKLNRPIGRPIDRPSKKLAAHYAVRRLPTSVAQASPIFAQASRIFALDLHSNSRTSKQRPPISNCKFLAKSKTTNPKIDHHCGSAPETARLVRRPNSVHTQSKANCLSNRNNRKRPTINDR